MSAAGAVWSAKTRLFYHCRLYAAGLRVASVQAWVHTYARLSYFVADWVLTTNHRRLAILYFAMIAITGFTGLVLATIIRLELAYPGQYFLAQNAERYLTTISLHGIIMVFYVVIPVLFGAFGNFLLPTQLGIRDVAFPRLNSFMFWVTPAGFVMLLHILLFDRAYNVTYWVNYSELRARLRRRFLTAEAPEAEFRSAAISPTSLSLRLHAEPGAIRAARSQLVQHYAPQVSARPFSLVTEQAVSVSTPHAASSARNGFVQGWHGLADTLGMSRLVDGIWFLWLMGRALYDALAQTFAPSVLLVTRTGVYTSGHRLWVWYQLQGLGLIGGSWRGGALNSLTAEYSAVLGQLADVIRFYGLYCYAESRWVQSDAFYLWLAAIWNKPAHTLALEAASTSPYQTGLSLHMASHQLPELLGWSTQPLVSHATMAALQADLRGPITSMLERMLALSFWGYGWARHSSGALVAQLPVNARGLDQLESPFDQRIIPRLAAIVADWVVVFGLQHCLGSGFGPLFGIWDARALGRQWVSSFSALPLSQGADAHFRTSGETVAALSGLFQGWKRGAARLWGAELLEVAMVAFSVDFGSSWTPLSLVGLQAVPGAYRGVWSAAQNLPYRGFMAEGQIWSNLNSALTPQPVHSTLEVATEVMAEAAVGSHLSPLAVRAGTLGETTRTQALEHEESLNGLLQDWRELKLEREVWRSLDLLGQSRQSLSFRRKYYAELFEPASMTSKVSTWMPNHLIPGWAFVTPYSSRLRYTALGKVDVALVVIFAAGLGSVFSSLNYVITYRYIGAPILKNRRELRSFFVDALLVASRMMIAANPALLIAILLLLSDRHFNTSVFDFSGGGDAVLFQHLFWFFGHPEVYIIVIPCFGFMNSLLPQYLRKRLSGRLSLQFSMYTIAFMGFAVWGHHMYMVGLANSVRTLYSTMTVMISVPASTKVLHWCVTLIQSTLVLEVGFLFLLNFMYFFVLGGLSGMFVAHIGFDTMFHDTFYVIGHFHVMFAGASVSCVFAAFYFYFSAIFGIRYSRFFAYLHYGLYTGGQLLTLIPMFWLGYAGMPRRIMDYPAAFGGWHSMISSGHFLTVLSLVFFLIMLLDSFYENRAPSQRMRGVSRLNTRLSFYAYECRKLQHFRSRALSLTRTNRVSARTLYQFCWTAETAAVEYVFRPQSK